jgi:Family of unknown function (DUF5723)
MNRVYSLSIILLISVWNLAFTQTIIPLNDSLPNYLEERITNNSNIFYISVDGNFASNFLDKDLIKENYWSKEIINNQLNRLKSVNFGGYGAEASANLHLFQKTMFGNESLSPWIGVKHQYFGGLSSNEDLIKLILEGNSSNQLISFNDGNNSTEFAQFSQGYVGFTQVKKSSKFSFAIGVVVGHDYSSSAFDKGSLVTEPQGEFIKAEDLDIVFENTSNSSSKGFGGVVHIEYVHQNPSGFRIFASINDLGFVRWSELETVNTLMNNFTFEGFDLTGFWERDYSVNFADSLEGRYFLTEEKSKIQILPFSVKTKFFKPIGSNNFIRGQLGYRRITGYIPQVSMEYGQYFSNKSGRWMIGADLGGFGLAALSFGTGIKISNGVGFNVKVSGIESYVSPNLPIYWILKSGLYFDI